MKKVNLDVNVEEVKPLKPKILDLTHDLNII